MSCRSRRRQYTGSRDRLLIDDSRTSHERTSRRAHNRVYEHAPKHRSSRHRSRAPAPGRELDLRIHTANIPHPEKAAKGGEDAWFFRRKAFGIFDGVGSWINRGVDSGLYSKRLAELTAIYLDHNGRRHVVDALRYAVRKNKEIGTCTACVTALCGRHLIGVNVGDSGLIVIRHRRVVFETENQQHTFNYPYQLGTDSTDRVRDGEFFDFKVRAGDVVVAASDGLWDNVPREEIVNRADHALQHGEKGAWERLKFFAYKLSKLANHLGGEKDWMSPYAIGARESGFDKRARGGKLDDITVTVALVK